MTVTIDIDSQALDRLSKKLKTFEEMERVLGPPMIKSMAALVGDLGKCPKKKKGAFSALATKKQRRAFWAKVSEDPSLFDERTGYRRSGTLGRKWTSEVKRVPGGWQGVVGNNTKYGPFVQGKRQQDFHRASKWLTTDEVLKKRSKAIQSEFRKAIRQALAR